MLKRICGKLTAGAEWLRAGYPTEAPQTGHSALLALNGPPGLTPKQKHRVAAELEGQPDTRCIEVAITKVTDQLPTPSQTHEMARLLRHHRPAQR